MAFDFDRIIERRQTDSFKWDYPPFIFPRPDLQPLWVADMDFASPPCVIEALCDRAHHGVFGYGIHPDVMYDLIIEWAKKRHQWDIQKEWILFTPGVVSAIAAAVSALTQSGDAIVVNPPVYHPFYEVVQSHGRRLSRSPLLDTPHGYALDFDNLEKRFAEGAKMMIFCSPHNPVGRVWREDELRRLAALCMQYDVLLVSDEIHWDVVLPGHRHFPLASLSEKMATRTVTCVAPSKTFNIPGLQCAFTIISNKPIRDKMQHVIHAMHLDSLNVFAMAALKAAYSGGEAWLDALLVYLKENADFVTHFVAERLPMLRVCPLEGTYLMWLDCKALGFTATQLNHFMMEKAGLAVQRGDLFGPEGAGFIRLNIACPKSQLKQAMEKLAHAIG